MDTSSSSEKLSETEDLAPGVNCKGDLSEPMVGSPPLFTAIPSTSSMLAAAAVAASAAASSNSAVVPMISCDSDATALVDSSSWSPKKDAMEGVPTELSALETLLPGEPSSHFVERVTQATDWFDGFKVSRNNS